MQHNPSLNLSKYTQWFRDHHDRILDDFFTFLSFPSISTDPAYKIQTHQTAEWLKEYLEKCGLTTELWETEGHPVLFATHMKAGPNRPTLLIYQHYDVQPADPLELWQSDPFKPVIKNNAVYARGALDNKGQCFYSMTALKAFLELADRIGVNLKLFIEGEEECGSKGTASILAKKKADLKADHLLVVDFDLPKAGVPGINLGMRGIISMELECANSKIDLHSGAHGGIALNPNRALAQALAQLWDENGRIAVPGFYHEVAEISKEELSHLNAEFDLEAYKKAFGVKAFAAEKGYTLVESNWLRPTLEINGMWGGYTGTGFKTVIPAKAYAKISCRLVPKQDPRKCAERVVDFIRSQLPEGIVLKADIHPGAPAYRSAFDSPIVKIAAKAYEEVFQKPCRYLLCGASVPIVVDLAAACGGDVAMMGMGLAEDDIHAPNEHFGLERFEQGFLTMSLILERLSQS